MNRTLAYLFIAGCGLSAIAAGLVAEAGPTQHSSGPLQEASPVKNSTDDTQLVKTGPGVTPPKVLYNPEPEYSDRARRKKESGVVVVKLVVGIDGKPRDLRIVTSQVPDLEKNVVDAVKAWRFKPAMKDGKPVATEIEVEVHMRLLN